MQTTKSIELKINQAVPAFQLLTHNLQEISRSLKNEHVFKSSPFIKEGEAKEMIEDILPIIIESKKITNDLIPVLKDYVKNEKEEK